MIIKPAVIIAIAVAIAGLSPATAPAHAARHRGSAVVHVPPANGRFDYQIGGAYRPHPDVAIVDRDRTASPADGFYNVCYINAFQSQAAADGWWRRHHPKLLLHDAHGRLVADRGWPGEYLLNTATSHSRRALARVEADWIDGCHRDRFDAVEPDNLDSYTRSHHLLTRSDNFAFARLLVARAHRDGLAIAQKNAAEQSERGRSIGFDFAIAEECQVYRECGRYLSAYGDEVFEIEYTDNGRRAYDTACVARGERISVVLRDRNVTPRGSKHYRYEAC